MIVRHRLAVVVAFLLGTVTVMWPGNAPAQTQPTITVAVGGGAGGGGVNCDGSPILVDGSFVLTVTGDVGAPTEVQLLWGGTAVPGTDYATPPTSITVTPGSDHVTVPVKLLRPPNVSNPDPETVVVTVLPGSGYSVGDPASATMTIGVIVDGCVVPGPRPVDTNPEFTG